MMLDGAIHRINHYPLAGETNICVNHWIGIYPVDNAIYLLNDWG